MKIATYNVNGINARIPVLLRWLKESVPDIACLQELKASQDNFPIKAINDAGYNAIWQGQKQWNGVAILAKKEIREVTKTLPGDENDLQSRYIEGLYNNNLVIACLYLPNGNPAPGPKFDYKLEWLKRFQKQANLLMEYNTPAIILGDFNIIPTELDVYKPERWLDDALFQPEVRGAFKNLLDSGWTDALRKLYPDEKIYTYWDYFRNAFSRNAGLRIDHMLLNPALKPKLISCGIDKEVRAWEKTSDHAPVWIELKD